VQALEQERDQWEQKYEEMATTHKTLKSELEDLQNQISSI
jgi:tropomyosin